MTMPAAIAVALLVGIMLPLQAVFNARLGRVLGSPIWASCVSGAVTTIILVVSGLLLTRSLPRTHDAAGTPWWAWAGGLCGVVALAGMTATVPRLGAATTIAMVVTGQIIFSLTLDHFGLFGLAATPFGPRRMLAAFLLLSGAVLIR